VRALLLAAGMGTRLRPLTDTIPKCLAPIHGRPLLDYWLELACPAVERVLVNTHYLADQVRDHVNSSAWKTHVDLVHEPELLGTAGTLAANRAWFGAGPALLAHADNLTDLDVGALASAHTARAPDCVMTMLTFEADDPRSCGIVDLDERGVVQGFFEKVPDPPSNLANAAVYVLEPEALDFVASLPRPFIDFSTQVIPALIGHIQATPHRGYHRDIGNPQSLALAEAEFPRPLGG
jgi:mannose-1-phosphate guanylyltransferase